MRKIYVLLFAALWAMSLSAQMRVWENGKVLISLDLSSIDSITFVKSGQDTVPPVDPDTTVTPPDTTSASAFDYDHWREQTQITIYGMTDPVALPWAAVASTSMPDEYKHPEKELRVDSITPRWQLAFNLCDNPQLPGVDMFGLWDALSVTMRIYAFIEELPNPNAHSCFLEVTSSVPAFVDGDTKCWMPAQSTIDSCDWSKPMSDASLPQPSRTTCQLLPVTGTLDGQINPGWLCFELDLSSGLFNIGKNDNISFALYGVQQVDFTGSMDISGTMQSYGGKITVPGSKLKLAGGLVGGGGDVVKSITDGVKGVSDGSGAFAVVGALGGIAHGAGKIINGIADGKDKDYQLDLNFNISATAEINGSLSSVLGTSVSSAQLDYSAFFENILSHSPNPQAETFTTNIWNLKNQPVYYICDNIEFGPDRSYTEFVRFGFFDPNSIEIVLTEDSTLFPVNQITNINVVAYDFAFVGDNYTLDAQPYYDFYGIPQVPANSQTDDMWFFQGALQYSDFNRFLLDTTATGQSITKNGIIYYGVTSSFDATHGMDRYNYVVSPCLRSASQHSFPDQLNTIGVVVILEVEFANGDKRLFAERFLPQIKRIGRYGAHDMISLLEGETVQTSVNGIPVNFLLYDVEQEKCLRLMNWYADLTKNI